MRALLRVLLLVVQITLAVIATAICLGFFLIMVTS